MGSCNWAAPSLAVCFERASFMPETMPALSSVPSRKPWQAWRGASVVMPLPIQGLVATTMETQVPPIRSCPLGAGQGVKAGTLAHTAPQTPGRRHPPLPHQHSTSWLQALGRGTPPAPPPLRWLRGTEITRGTTKPSLPFSQFTSLTLSPD